MSLIFFFFYLTNACIGQRANVIIHMHAMQQLWLEMFILTFVLSGPKGSAKLRSMHFSHNGWTRHFTK